MRIATQVFRMLLICLAIIVGSHIIIVASLAEEWRSDDNVHRILSGRSDHAIPLGLLPNDRRLEFAELCILHLRRHIAGDHLLTDHQLVNLLGWITRASFNDAAIYLDALLAEDLAAERRSQVMEAIERAIHPPTRLSAYTSMDEARNVLEGDALRTTEARLSLALVLAVNDDDIAIDYIERLLIDPAVSDDLASRAALFTVREKVPIALAFEYCERILNRDDVAIGRRTAAANALMRNGIPAAIEWTENALHHLPLSEHHRVRLLSGLIQNSQTQRLVDLVSILGSTSSINVAQTRIELDTLIDLNAGLLGDVRRLSDAELQASLLELIETHGNRLKWDAEETGRLVLEK